MAEVVGYARVSTDGQSVHDQIVQLKAAGATRVLSEKLSGARFDRPQLRKAIAGLSKGDVLLVTRLDRLARSTRVLLNLLHEVGERGAAVQEPGRRLGRYHHAARQVDGGRSGRTG
jgi:DNA invertase Pin-like site-specific DNA recombinase